MKDVAYYAVNDRPVKVVKFPDGSSDILVFDWSTGAFVPDRSYWEHIRKGDPFKDVDSLTSEQFESIVAGPRAHALHKHTASAISWEVTSDPHVFRAPMGERTLTVRDDGSAHLTLFVDDQRLGDVDRWPTAWRLPDGVRHPSDQMSQRGPTSEVKSQPRAPTLYYTVGARPVKVVTLASGERLAMTLDVASGAFVPSVEPWTDQSPRMQGTVEHTIETFDELVRPLRTRAVVELVKTPIVWESSNDAASRYRATHRGHAYTIRLNDFPEEPLFTLLVDNEELADLEDWPDSWSRP